VREVHRFSPEAVHKVALRERTPFAPVQLITAK
jgi:hypothetical protein